MSNPTASHIAMAQDLPALLARRPGHVALAWLVATALVLILLRAAAQIDLTIAAFFATPGLCAEAQAYNCTPFALSHEAVWRSVRRAGIYLPYGVIGVFVMLLIARLRAKTSAASIFVPLLAVGSALLGPVLVTNVILKGNWGRPRPEDIDLFGGTGTFVLPGTWSAQCDDNCSFPSGEATFAAWSIMAVALVPARWRWPTAMLVFAFYIGVSALRVAFGKHFASDVVMGGFVAVASILLVNWALWRWRIANRLAGWAAAR